MHVDAEHVRELIESLGLQIRDRPVSKAANDYLERSFPFPKFDSTRIIDWKVIPHVELDWMSASDDETSQWASSTLIGANSMGLLLFDQYERCLIGPVHSIIRNLDTLSWGSPGPKLLFGIETLPQGELRFTRGIVEYNGRGTLFASI